MAFAILRSSGEFDEISGAFTSGEGADAVNHPAEWLDASTPSQRYARSIYVVREPDAVPAGKREVGRRIENVDGKPVRVLQLEDVPADQLRTEGEAAILAERGRRLSLGFSFDFGDDRGVHHIGTTPEDMKGWDEVTAGAQAAINLGTPDAPIGVVTDTGPVTLTAHEWQLVLARASQVRQPIYAASFNLQAMDPIPTNVSADEHWPA